MKRLIVSVLALVLFLAAFGARAQDMLRIAAVVNDEVISIYDLNMRLNLVVALSGLPNTIETRQKLGPQVLRSLIDDELKHQEATRLGIPVSENEVEVALRRLEKGNGFDRGGLDKFLASRRIKKSSLTDQIESEISWRKLVQGRYGANIQISDEEIDEVLREIEGNKGKPEYLVFEIFLPVDKPQIEQEILTLAHRLIQQTQAGANFQALAQNFSKSSTAERGGSLGWNRLGQLGNELDQTLAKLQPGQLSPPIRTVDGYYILYLKEQRIARGLGDSGKGSPVVNLQQLFLPLPPDASPAAVSDAMEGGKNFGKLAKSCKDLDRMGKEIESPLSGNLGDIKTSALAPQQRNLVRGLPPLKASRPLRTKDGVIVLMVCRREEVKKAEMTVAGHRERIADRLINERMGLSARQHMRDLRRSAFVDIRL
jgi:peptidyl-prolyl cis-trans isomerase SurA